MKKGRFISLAIAGFLFSVLSWFCLIDRSVAQFPHGGVKANLDLSQPCLEQLNDWTREVAYTDTLLDVGGKCYLANDFESAEYVWRIALDVYTSSDDKE